MATTTPTAKKSATAKKTPTTAPSRPARPASSDGRRSGSGALEQALNELDRLRDVSGEDVRRQLDAAVSRIREVADDLRERSEDRTATLERAVRGVADDAWQQLATMAIRGLHDPDALTELSNEIRKRKTELRRPARKASSAAG